MKLVILAAGLIGMSSAQAAPLCQTTAPSEDLISIAISGKSGTVLSLVGTCGELQARLRSLEELFGPPPVAISEAVPPPAAPPAATDTTQASTGHHRKD